MQKALEAPPEDLVAGWRRCAAAFKCAQAVCWKRLLSWHALPQCAVLGVPVRCRRSRRGRSC